MDVRAKAIEAVQTWYKTMKGKNLTDHNLGLLCDSIEARMNELLEEASETPAEPSTDPIS